LRAKSRSVPCARIDLNEIDREEQKIASKARSYSANYMNYQFNFLDEYIRLACVIILQSYV